MYFGVCVVCDLTYDNVCNHKTCPHCCLVCWYITRKPKVFEVPGYSLVNAFHYLGVKDESVFSQRMPLWSDDPVNMSDSEIDVENDIETMYDFLTTFDDF